MDTSKRASKLSTEEKAILPELKPIERNEVLLDKRVQPNVLPKKNAPVGERQSPVSVSETREKKTFVAPDPLKYDVIERKDSPWSGKKSRFSTADDAYRTKTATRFQDKISDASPVTRNVEPAINKRTTFDRINRFVFQKNSDQTVSVSTAGSEKPSSDASSASSPGASVPRR